MIRSKSSISLRNLANSLKNSIHLDRHKSHKKQFIPLKKSATTFNLINDDQQKIMRNQQDYLLLMQTRKSRFTSIDASNRINNTTKQALRNDKQSDYALNRKQRLLQMTRKTNAQIIYQTALPKQQSDITKSTYNNALQYLYDQHRKLSKNLQQSQSKYEIRNYNKYLQDVDELSKQLKQIQRKEFELKQHRNEVKNRFCFLNQERISIQMNQNQRLAQKQYCEQFLDKYKLQYQLKQQSKLVIEMLQLQNTNSQLDRQAIQLNQNLNMLQEQFRQWKNQQNIQLKQKRFDNKLKQSRIQLMKIQQDLDDLTETIIDKIKNQQTPFTYNYSQSQIGVRKIRQYICAYFKKYNQININHISHAQIADGIDIFLCKDGLIKDFAKYIMQKTQKMCLTNGLYSLKFTQYIDLLKKIQGMFINEKNQVNKVIGGKFTQKIILIKQKLQSLLFNKQKNTKKINDIKQSIQKILAQDSLSLIELLNKNGSIQYKTSKKDGFLNVNQIKYKVRQLKLDQTKRIKRIKQIFTRLKTIQCRQNVYFQTHKQKQQQFVLMKQQLSNQLNIFNNKIREIGFIRKGFQLKKQKYENIISKGISKIKQKDQLLNLLKTVQTQIQNTRKQKIMQISQKHNHKIVNYNNQYDPNRHNYLFTNTLKQNNKAQTNFNRYLRLNINNNQDRQAQTYYSGSVNLLPKFNDQGIIQSQTHQIQNLRQKQQTVEAQFQVTKRLPYFKQQKLVKENQYKIQRNTQASPRCLKQLQSFNLSNNILGSKNTLVQSKTVPSYSRYIKKSYSTSQLGRKTTKEIQNYKQKQNQIQFVSKRQSLSKNQNLNTNKKGYSKVCSKPNLSIKNKNLDKNKVQSRQKSNLKQNKHKRIPSFQSVKENINPKIQSNRNTPSKKLSLQSSKNISQIKNINSSNNAINQIAKKNINQIITSKLLHR